MPNALIDTPQTLDEVCEHIRTATHAAIDTEFIRQRTFRPQLCLIQIAVHDDIYCVDPLAFDDLTDLMTALNGVEIVIHSARQDIEALFQTTGTMLTPLFDTQVAAGLTGLGDQVSYSGLVQNVLDVELDKGETRTNWAQRPLTEAQVRYAEDDVRYLLKLLAPLKQRLIDTDRLAWHQQECDQLGNPALYSHDPGTAWTRVKGTRPLSRSQRRGMKRLAAWREEQAWNKDKPRKWIMSDEDLVTLALHEPDSPETLTQLLDARQRYLRQHSDDLFAVLQQALDDPIEPPFTGNDPEEMRRIKLCMGTLREAAQQADISPSLLGTRKDVTHLVRGEPSPLLESWRFELIGQSLQTLLADR
ncbi:MAG: ribonuclease D [Pseudomonadota bacterium]